MASGIIEIRGDRETMLDDAILEVDQSDQKGQNELTDRTDLEKKLFLADNEIRK